MSRLTLSSLIVLYIVFLGCNLHKQMPIDSVEYFEGEIEYKMTFESLHPIHSSEDFSSTSANRKIQRFKKGSFVTEFYNNDSLIRRTWFDRSSNRTYIQKMESDTLYFYNAKNVDFIIEPFEVSDGAPILEYSTRKVTLNLKGKDSSDYAGNDSQFVFHIATDLPIDPNWYKDYLEFDFNKIMAAAPGIILKEEDIIVGLRKVTKTATRIEHKTVELDLSVDPSKKLIEI